MLNRRSVIGLVIAALSLSAAPAGAEPSDTDEILQRAKQLESEGKVLEALENCRAAIALEPNAPAPHLCAANTHFAAGHCCEATTEYRAYVEHTPPEARQGADWSAAMANLATCESAAARPEAEQCAAPKPAPAHLNITADMEVRCSLDGGSVVNIASGSTLSLETAAGPHSLTCATDDKRQKRNISLAANETRALSFDFGAAKGGDDFVLLPPEPEAPKTVVPQKPITLQVTAEGRGWTCRIEDTPPLTPDSSGVLVAQLPPGKHGIACEREGFVPFVTEVNGTSGEVVKVEAVFKKKEPPPAPAPIVWSKPAEKEQPEPPPPPPRDADFAFSAGFSPSNGLFGVGIGARYKRWGVSVGSGAYPLGASLLHYFNPGLTGLYLSVGYLRIAPGLIAGGSDITGHEFYATGGVDIRFRTKLGVRIGLGAGYKLFDSKGESAGKGQHADGRGPVVFDFALNYAL